MSVRRRANLIGQQRIDIPHLKSIESAVSNDFDELLSGLVLGENQSYVVRGFKVNMSGAIGASASGLQLIVEDSSFLHGASNESGTFFSIPSGTAAEILNSTTNDKVEGSFGPTADNYIGIEFTRNVDDSTTDQVNFWNPTTNVETTKTVPLAITLDYKIVITTSNFASNVMPVAIVRTDASNNVVSVTDRRRLLYRLGTAGDSDPNPFYEYPWAEGRAENFYTSTSPTSSPFEGGDKQLNNMKDFFDALMTEIKLIKGTPYWYSNSVGSIYKTRQDLANTAFTGKGSVVHGPIDFQGQVAGMTTDVIIKTSTIAGVDNITLTADSIKDIDTLISDWNAANPDNQIVLFSGDGSQVPTANIEMTSKVGQLNWNSDININFIGGRLKYVITKNEATTDATLTDNQVAYVELIRGQNISPNLVFTNGSAIVTSVGAIAWTTDLQAGDFVKDASRGDEFYYEIQSVDSSSQVTLTTTFQETSSGTSGFDAQYAFGVYETNPSPSTSRHVQIADRGSVPFGEDYFWLFFRQDDTGSVAKIYARVLGGQELEQGESQEISDNTSLNIINYIGSTSDSDNDPQYNSINYLTQGENLTSGLGTLDSSLKTVNDLVNQNKNTKLVKGGTWSWNAVSNELTLSASAYISMSGLAEDVNEISAQTITLSSDGQCAYVTVKRTAGASVLAVSTADIASVPSDDNVFIIARRVGNDVLVGTNSFLLKSGEFLEIDGALAEINRYNGQAKISPANPVSTRVIISASDIQKLDSSKLSLQQRNLLMSFAGAQIDFETGEVFESDGVTPFLGGANDFAPFTIGANEYFYYSITLLPETTNADNTINGQILILPASASNAVLADAPKAPFSSAGISIGQVYVQEDGSGGILDINYANIVELSVGGSGGGSGTGFVKVDYHDPISTTLPTGATVTIDGQAGVDGDLVLFSNLLSGNNKIYELSGVGSSISWEATLDFNLGTPEDGDSVIVKKGEAFRDTVGLFNDTNWKFNDTVRFFDGANYWEQSSLKRSDIAASTIDNIFVVDVAGSENMIIDYSLLVGSDKETGQVIVTSDGSNAKVSRNSANLSETGVELTADISGSDIRFRYENTTANAGTISYSVKRWSNSAGGPGGIPSYSGSTGSSTVAAGNTQDIQYKGASGNLEGDSDFQWDTSNKIMKLGDLHYEILQGPLVINDNQALATTIITYTAATYKNAVFEYSIERDGENRIGRLLVVNNGTDVNLTDDSTNTGGAFSGVSDSEIVFSAVIVSGDVLIRYTSTSTGQNGEMKYSVRKW